MWAPEESGELKIQEGHHNGDNQGTQRANIGGQDQTPPRAANQHQIQKDFRKKFHGALNDLKAKEKASRGDEEPTEGTQEEAQHSGPRGL